MLVPIIGELLDHAGFIGLDGELGEEEPVDEANYDRENDDLCDE